MSGFLLPSFTKNMKFWGKLKNMYVHVVEKRKAKENEGRDLFGRILTYYIITSCMGFNDIQVWISSYMMCRLGAKEGVQGFQLRKVKGKGG